MYTFSYNNGVNRKDYAIAIINSAEDMQWLKDVHVRILPDNARSAIIFGNEDAPDSIEVYDSVQPLVTDTPIMLCSAEFLNSSQEVD